MRPLPEDDVEGDDGIEIQDFGCSRDRSGSSRSLGTKTGDERRRGRVGGRNGEG